MLQLELDRWATSRAGFSGVAANYHGEVFYAVVRELGAHHPEGIGS
jgi:hypothetical protein